MKHPTLADQLRHYLQTQGTWIKKNRVTDDLRWTNQKNFTTYSAPTVDRELRKMEETKVIAVKYDNGKALYRYIPSHLRADYITIAERTEKGIEGYRWSKLTAVT